jgi:2'-5' RNA ligase
MSSKKRLFVAIDIPKDIKAEIAQKIEPLKVLTNEVTWVEPGNYHFTLQFLGAVEEELIPKISAQLKKTAESIQRFELYLRQFNILPEHGPARVIYLEVGGGEEDMNTAAFEIEEALASVGINKEHKQFVAHLTVGRIKKDQGLEVFKDKVKSIAGIAREVGVAEFVLFESELTHAGPTYRVIERFAFKL